MPKVSLSTVADRADGVLTDMHPRLDGSVILLPDDLSEGKGNFLNVDHNGNPEGFELVQLPQIVSRDVYMGTSRNKITKQNTIPMPVHEGSYLVNGPLATGDEEPDDLFVAPLPKPLPPTIKVRTADVAGYPASTEESPYWLALSAVRNGVHGPLSPPVKLPPLAQGQCFKLMLPDSLPVGATHLGVWLSHPGQSTASTTGQMRLQKVFLFSSFFGEMDFTGPYVYSTVRPSDTALSVPGKPAPGFSSARAACRIGSFYFRVTAANELGESLPSAMVGPITVSFDSRYDDDQGDHQAGAGHLTLTKGSLPQGATGWFAYALIGSQWHRIYNKYTGEGLSKPFAKSTNQVQTTGWTGSEELAENHQMLLSSQDLPTENTSGVANLDSAPESPTAFGASRPGPGRYYARQLERSENDDESPLSDAAYADVGENEVMEVVFSNPLNHLPNATFVTKGADGYPLGYSVSGSSAGVDLENGKLILNGSDNPTVTTDWISVDTRKPWSVGGTLEVEGPGTGALSGSFEVVLREINASAQSTDTVLATVSSLGEHRFYSTISPRVPSAIAPIFQDDTQTVQIIYRFSSANMRVSVSRQLLKDYLYGFRRREASLAEGPANSNPAPETTANPSGGVAVEPSPAPETSSELVAQTAPDRPLSSGTALDTQGFDSAVPGAPWTQDTSGATLTTASGKLVSQKTGAGVGRSNISRTITPETGLAERHALGVAANGLTVPTLPANGSITLLELGDFAWIDADTRYEVARLRIDQAPTTSGNFSTTLDESTPVTRSTALVATRHTSTLSINAVPTAAGTVSITVGDVTKTIPVVMDYEGVKETVTLEITHSAAATGLVGLEVIGTNHLASVAAHVVAGDSPEEVARKIRAYPSFAPSWSDEQWTLSGSGRSVVLTAKTAGEMPGPHTFRDYGTYVTGRVTTIKGIAATTADTPTSLVEKIRSTSFGPGYKTSATGTQVTIEALEPGARGSASYDPGATGATGTMTTIDGAQDTAEEVAAKIVATYSGNTYHSATANGALVTFQALSSGDKQDMTFSPGSTGAVAEGATAVQGSSDVIAYVKDRFDIVRQRRLFSLDNTTSYNLGLSVSGAGYPHTSSPDNVSRAVVQVWASTSTAVKTLMALFEDVDLGGLPASSVAAGVTAESSTSLLWEVRIDELKVTDRGESYYRYHDYLGNLLNQIHFFFPSNLLPSEGLGLQGFRRAVLPETEYTASIFARWAGFTTSEFTEPLYLYCVTPDDEIKPLGDLTGAGIKGTSAWHETAPFTFTIPANCYELRLESKTVSAGELVIQEFALSKGSTVKRTPLYATEGSYVATLNIATPYMRGPWWSRERRELGASIDTPDGTSADVLYMARDAGGSYGTPVSDPTTLEQKNEIRVDIAAFGDGLHTPAIRSGSPSTEYVLLVGLKSLATLLKSDRTELDGGAIFAKLNRYSERPEVSYQPLVGRRFLRIPVYPPVGNNPAFELQVFTPEAKKYLEDRAGMEDFVIEAWDKILTIRLSGDVLLEPQSPDYKKNGRWYGHYVGKFPEAQVIAVEDLP